MEDRIIESKMVVLLFIGILASNLAGVAIGINYMEKQAIENKVAEYNPVTANFEWRKR